ncbi:DUF2282 domain-containing protein [Duganella sp. FT92W]|uniref:DUF2282 domain-containing protein n=1 Tax=Pseudoduganella rivuli TaxID=2666085 RepID=A0A7X2IQL7_9BURK|nr:DUF2282 domain-containing protein [Pseudoduganella rivuli]
MFKKIVYVTGFLFLAQITHAIASDEVQAAPPQTLRDLFAATPQVEWEKCFALPDAKPKECAADPDTDECKAAEQKPKDGTEFKYVRRGTCIKQGGKSMMAQRHEPQK